MKETIIFSNTINQTEFLRSLSLRGKNTFGVRVLSSNELCDEVNARTGFLIKDNFLSSNDSLFLIYDIAIKEHNFSSFNDIKHIAQTLNTLRNLITEDNEVDVFNTKVAEVLKEDKNINILKAIFTKYIKTLKDTKQIDNVSYVKEIIKINKKVFDEILVINDKLTPLEEKLLTSIADKVTITTLGDYLKLKNQEEIKIRPIVPAFGERNEIEEILNNIFSNGYNLDECSIVLANKNKYAFLLNEYRDRYHIPMTFEMGLPIVISNPYKLYRALEKLEKEHFFDVTGYKSLFLSEAFTYQNIEDTLDYNLRKNAIEILGRLKIGFCQEENDRKIKEFESINPDNRATFLEKIDRNMEVNRVIGLVKEIAKIFSLGRANILKLCSVIRDDEYRALDNEALEKIVEILNEGDKHNFSPVFKESFLTEIDGQYLSKAINKEGCLHVTTLEHGLSSLRKHIYLMGFSSNNFPGKAVEDYLLPNEAIALLTSCSSRYSEQSIKDRILAFNDYIKDCSLLGLDVNLSYSCQDIKEVKDVNPSSVLLNLVQDQEAFDRAKESAGYFKTNVSKISPLIKAFLNHEKLNVNGERQKQELDHYEINKLRFSPSAINTFFECPLKFYLNNMLCADKEKEYDYFNSLGGPVFGNLLHLVIEMIYKKHIPDDEVVNYIKDVYNDYQKFDVSLNDPNVNLEEFLDACLNAYHYTQSFEIIATEQKVYGQVNGLNFKGEIDAIGKKDDKYYIIDFKTARNIEHEDNDIEKDIQAIIYSYLYEQKTSIKVEACFFYYARIDKVISFDNPFTKEVEDKVFTKIDTLKGALEKHFFPAKDISNQEKDKECPFCNYQHICSKGEKL